MLEFVSGAFDFVISHCVLLCGPGRLIICSEKKEKKKKTANGLKENICVPHIVHVCVYIHIHTQ